MLYTRMAVPLEKIRESGIECRASITGRELG
jgi:hypothetical protein